MQILELVLARMLDRPIKPGFRTGFSSIELPGCPAPRLPGCLSAQLRGPKTAGVMALPISGQEGRGGGCLTPDSDSADLYLQILLFLNSPLLAEVFPSFSKK